MISRRQSARVPSTPWFVVCVAVIFLAGCGGSGDLVPVEGLVTLNGRPLADASVTLTPVRAIDPGPFVGKTDAEGRFVLSPPGSERGGVAVGEYFLYITTVEPVPDADEFTPAPTQREIVPPQYSSGAMRFEVPPGGNADVRFDM